MVNRKAPKEGSEVCVLGSKWVVGDGREARLWTNRWLGHSPLRNILQGPLSLRDED